MFTSLIEKLKLVNDPRKAKGKQYPLWVLLILIIIAKLFEKNNYTDIAHFLEVNKKDLKKNLELSLNKMPSLSTIRRTMMDVDMNKLMLIANEWMWLTYPGKNEDDWLAIDGKKLRNTETNNKNSSQNAAMIVSIFSPNHTVAVHCEIMETKQTSELNVSQGMVRNKAMVNKTFTGDALYCNIKLIEIITAQNNDYLLTVKNNNPKLLAHLKTYIQNNLYTTENITTNKGHGRLEKRQVRVFDVSNISKKWRDNLNSIIELKRTITRKGKIQETTQYYISSKIENAQTFNEKIREHWAIENQLHWVKDVIFNEDNSGIHDFQPATNLSILTTIAMNLYRCWGFKSIKKGMRWLEKRMNNLFIIDDFFDDISQKPA